MILKPRDTDRTFVISLIVAGAFIAYTIYKIDGLMEALANYIFNN